MKKPNSNSLPIKKTKNDNQIFEVDIQGLRQLQSAKPKWFIIRELLQNAIDEEITTCKLELDYKYGFAHITVTDDSPTGFIDLSHAYTLFKDTYKRNNVHKRGRFNFGEKQVLCLCETASIKSTTGGFEFDIKNGIKTKIKTKTERGSEINVKVKMTIAEFCQCQDYSNDILIPPNIKVIVRVKNEEKILPFIQPFKTFKAKLPTEVKGQEGMRVASRETTINLHKKETKAYIYELGIPICEIDCNYSIDVQQKVPMSNDRDKVDGKYLKLLYGEVLNHTYSEISEEQSSQLWVRTATTSDRAKSDTVKEVITKRFGEKVLVANPKDKNSIDEAISHGYKVVYGAEMDKEEWKKIKEFDLMESTTKRFKVKMVDGVFIIPNTPQSKIAVFCTKIAMDMMDFDLEVLFYDSVATVMADFGGDKIRFNINRIDPTLFCSENGRIKQKMLDLIIHELGHKKGNHTEHSYHECITELGSKLVVKALENPEYFKL